MLTVTFILIVIALLFGAGAIPSRLLFPDDRFGLRSAIMPVLGFALLVMAVQTLYLFGWAVHQQAPFLVVAILALSAADRWWSIKRPSLSPDPATNPPIDTDRRVRSSVLACGAFAVLLCGWPGIYYGNQTYMAYANPDANNYQFMAERYLDHPHSEKIVLDGFHPGNYYVNWAFQTESRTGVDAYLAWVSAVCNTTTKQGYWIAVCSFVFLIPLSVYVFVFLGLEADRRVALLTAGLMATSSLVGLLAFQELLGNLGGLAVLPAALGCMLACLRKVSIRICIATAILCGGLLSVYPEILFLLGPVVIGATTFLARQLGIGKIARNAAVSGVAVLAGTLLINPFWGYYGIRYLFQQAGAVSGGDSYGFSFTKAILPVAFGLLPFPAATLDGGLLFHAFRIFSYCGGALCVLALAWYASHQWRSMARDAVRLPLLGGLAALFAVAGYLAFDLHYSYGFFKVFLYGEFLIVTVLASSAYALWNDSEVSWGRWGKRAGAAIVLIVAGCNLLSVLWYGAVSLTRQLQYGIVNEVALSGDTSFDDLEELRHIVAPSESVMLDAHSGIVQMWAAYGMRDLKVSLMQPLLYFQSWTNGGAADFTHAYGDRYILTESGAHSDIIVWQSRDAAIWKSPRFELYPFRDYVALDANWYGLEHGKFPWRWLNNDGEILLIRPSERHYQVAFECAPGPGVPGSIRHVEVLVNGTKIYAQATNGVTLVTSPLFAVDKVVNRIAIHIIEKPTLIPTDSRLLNVSIGKVRVTGEEAAQKLIEAENPREITLKNLPQYVSSMTGIYSDTWVGPAAELWLGCRGAPRQLMIEGELPPWIPFAMPLRIRISANGKYLGDVSVTAKGKFSGVVAVPPEIRSETRLRVALASDRSFTGQESSKNGDTRPLTFFFRAIRLQ